uniref:Secreted protein n=1 Tax=Cyanistes caeruleus TaxID=156563 RepID=A0A8C0VI94_CYACU
MCLVFCAFASWAVKTSDLQAPDAWKTSTYSASLERGGQGSEGHLAGRKNGVFLPAVGKCSLFLVFQSGFHALSPL